MNQKFIGREFGRSDRIRTCDPQSPRLMRYRAALRSDRDRPERIEGVFQVSPEEARLYKPTLDHAT